MDQQPTRHLNFYTKLSYLLLFITIAPMVNANSKNSERFRLIPNHQSEYRIEKYSNNVGNVKNVLNYSKNVVKYSSIASATGIASFFIKDDHEETSILYWPKNTQYPKQQSFNYFRGKKHKKNQQILFKYIKAESTLIDGNYKRKSYTLETSKTVWTRQLLPILISSELQNSPNTKVKSFFITNKGHIQEYTYTLEALEKMSFKQKQLDVLKFKISREKNRRTSYVWLSKDHYYLPLKIEHYKDDKLNVSMFMTQFKLN
ncbi:hypothetical protein MNBD_GAMMA07-2347 [hydrothermal vent metagenome]|uniref:DUF3108 domain-containing protein n=1 Tax=hydrothermal vent metagenome TaxID=652676 RepID=A0A3B0WYF7_9ZZZZ